MVSLLMPDGLSFLILCLLLLQHSCNVAALGVEFTTPPAGATFPSGNFTVRWKDAEGSAPVMSDLSTYTLDLIVGGNSATDSTLAQHLSDGNIKQGGVSCNISSGAAQSIQNGFYLRMTSNTTTGNSVINYSHRFTLIQMSGTTDSKYVQAASHAVGDSNVPGAQYNVRVLPAPSSHPPSPSATPDPASSASTGDSGPAAAEPTSSMSTAAVVGITISVSVVCTALIIAAGWYWRKRKREKETRKSLPAHYLGSKAELASYSPTSPPAVELTTTKEVVEMDSSSEPEELAGTPVFHELESDWTGWEMSARRSHLQSYDPTK